MMRLIKHPFLAALCLAAAAAAHAAPVKFDLVAQAAPKARVEFSKQAGVEVLLSFDDLKSVDANAVLGSFEPADALDVLLRGTGFAARRRNGGKFIIRRAPGNEAKIDPANPGSATAANGNGRASPLRPKHRPGDDPVIRLEDYVVTPSRFGIADERIAGNATLTSDELATLPQIGEDLFRTITRLPGLAANDASARFLVRGAPSSQILTRLNSVDLIDPFHRKEYDGALSIVDLETVGSIDLVTGGFTAEYGDRLAGVLKMETRTEARPGRHTTLGISVTNSACSGFRTG
jgi:hypothetical protein